MRIMSPESPSDPSQYRVTLFFGPKEVEGKPCTQTCVFNVKKRSWKGGIQVAVDITNQQIETGRVAIDYPQWLADAAIEDRSSQADRARELFVQALCWCKLDLLLQSGLAQDNQRLPADRFSTELREAAKRRREFITSYMATELDLLPGEKTSS